MDAVNLKFLTGPVNAGAPARPAASVPQAQVHLDPADEFSEDDAFAFLENWSKQDAPSVKQLADVVPAAPPPVADATWQIEQLVARNRDVFARCNAPTNLLMSDESHFFSGATSAPLAPSDHNTWHLSDGRS